MPYRPYIGHVGFPYLLVSVGVHCRLIVVGVYCIVVLLGAFDHVHIFQLKNNLASE